MDEIQFRELKVRLSAIEKLLAINLVKEKSSQKERILTLSSFGFTNSQIAEFLGTTSNAVGVVLSRERKRAKR